jgi:hypothetical protein
MRRSNLALATGVAAALCAGCGSMIVAKPLATGRPDVAAYELQGDELPNLRREAMRLCPNGADVVRQAAFDQRPEREDGRVRRWINATGEWLSPPKRMAQLVVVCKEVPDDVALPSRAQVAAAAASAAAEAAQARAPAPVPPIGPINVQW